MAYQPDLPPSRRLLLALAASLLLHATGIALLEWLAPASQLPKPAPAAVLHASLLMRPAPSLEPPPAAEPLLKDTSPAAEPQSAAAVPTADLSARKPSPAPRAATEASAQRKLSEHVYYPPEAVAQGLQGEVRLLVALDRGGNIVQAKVIVSSGHAVLDQAAVRAAYAIGRLPRAGALDLVLPVIFKLE
jgi:protein TonB